MKLRPSPLTAAPSPEVVSRAAPPAAAGPCRDWVLYAREDVRAPESFHELELVVRRLQKVAPPHLYGVQSLGPSDPERIGKNYGWKHPRAPSVRWLWREVATGVVLEFVEDTRVGCRVSSQRTRVDEDRDEAEGRRAPALGCTFLCSFFCLFPFVPFCRCLFFSFVSADWEIRVPKYDPGM